MTSKKTPKTQNKTSQMQVNPQLRNTLLSAANAVRLPRIGMGDLVAHEISWLAGYIWVGNGTLGATDSVYFTDSTKTYTVVADTQGSNVPFAPADPTVGASYVSDVMKHFARLKIRRAAVELLSLQPSTTNSMVVVVGPSRGAGNVGTIKTDTTAANTYTNIISMSGARQAASWESCSIDVSQFIAGGSGPQQNEFQMNQIAAGGLASGTVDAFQGIVPLTFAVSGVNGTTALRGTTTHAVIGRALVDLIDFVGGQSNVVPVGLGLLGKRSTTALSLLEVQKASRGGMLKFDTPSELPTGSSTGESKLDVLASVSTKHGALLDRLKAYLNECVDESSRREVLAILAERL